MVAMKQMIQRPAHEPKVGVKGIEHATTYPGVEQSTNLPEQSGCFGPGDIVQIPGNDDRRVRFG